MRAIDVAFSTESMAVMLTGGKRSMILVSKSLESLCRKGGRLNIVGGTI